ncbi:MAG: hypothetical protein AAGL89_03135 [Pseudomonadota bacterium]
MKTLICMAVFCATLSTAAVAENDAFDVCTYDQTNLAESLYPHLVGNWSVSNGPGFATGPGGFYTTFGPEAGGNADFRMSGEDLSVLDWSGETDSEFPVTFYYDAFEMPEGLEAVPLEDVLTTLGTECDDTTLPTISVDGGFWSANLIVASPDFMYGSMTFVVSGLVGYRSITMTR